MKQNIFITCNDMDLLSKVAEKISEKFDKRVLNQIDLFEFDNIPRTLSEMLELKGLEYVDKKMKSIIKLEFSYSDTVFICPLNFALYADDLFYKIKLENVVCLIHTKGENVADDDSKSAGIKYITRNKEETKVLEDKIEKFCADVVVDGTSGNVDTIFECLASKIAKI